jgi:hypothetical protein
MARAPHRARGEGHHQEPGPETRRGWRGDTARLGRRGHGRPGGGLETVRQEGRGCGDRKARRGRDSALHRGFLGRGGLQKDEARLAQRRGKEEEGGAMAWIGKVERAGQQDARLAAPGRPEKPPAVGRGGNACGELRRRLRVQPVEEA